MKTFIKKLHSNRLLFWFLLLTAYLPVGLFIIVSGAIMGYIHWPLRQFDINLPDQVSSKVIIVTHGVKDNTAGWVYELNTKLKQSTDYDVFSLDWSEYAQNPLTCSVNGEQVGRIVANQLATNHHLKEIQLIGHSCGAFVLYGFCNELSKLRNDVSMYSVYLSPVSIYGGIFGEYGADYFGRCATGNVAYIDSDDRTPGTNKTFTHLNEVNITTDKEKYGYTGSAHMWPTRYLIVTDFKIKP